MPWRLPPMSAAHQTYLLRLGDNALVLGHRVSEWCSRAPTLEEDIALANLGLDLIGQARLLYQHACALGDGRQTEDDIAFLREDHEFRNVLLVEQPNGDFAWTMMRHLLFAAHAELLYRSLTRSTDSELAAIAGKAVKEMVYHVRHAGEWLIRLGDGTAESHARAQAAADGLMIFVDELFEIDATEEALIAEGVAVDPRTLRRNWQSTIDHVFAEATLTVPSVRHGQSGGRDGRHSEHLSRMLAEMQSLHRAHPGVSW
jgi:ring-1,2-phenylacetyl-CoA epoxidase subunit PaaC